MHFGRSDVSIGKPDIGYTFERSPPARAKLTPQAHDVSDCPSNGNRLDVANIADDLKIHIVILVLCSSNINIPNAGAAKDFQTTQRSVEKASWGRARALGFQLPSSLAYVLHTSGAWAETHPQRPGCPEFGSSYGSAH